VHNSKRYRIIADRRGDETKNLYAYCMASDEFEIVLKHNELQNQRIVYTGRKTTQLILNELLSDNKILSKFENLRLYLYIRGEWFEESVLNELIDGLVRI